MGNVTSHTGHGTASGLIGSTVRDGGESGTVDIVGTLPDDVAFQVLDHLDFDDIERVKQVCRTWRAVGNSEPVWRHHCALIVPSLRVRPEDFPSWKEAYKVLRYGTQLANRAGIDQALRHYDTYCLLAPASPDAVAQLLNGCTLLDKSRVGQYLSEHHDTMAAFFRLQQFEHQFLPEAMRTVFSKARFPCVSSLSMAPVIRNFVERFTQCNPGFAADSNHVYILCYSVILLGVDLTNPHVKTKMTKREYCKNHRGILPFDQDYFIRIYDDVFLHGHVVEPRKERKLVDALKTIAS